MHSTTCAALANASSRSGDIGVNGTSTIALDGKPQAPCTRCSVSSGGGGEVDDGVGGVEVELDELARILGDVAALGDHQGDRVTDVAHVADGERRRDLQLLAEHRVPRLAVGAVEVLPREHGDDTGRRAGAVTSRM